MSIQDERMGIVVTRESALKQAGEVQALVADRLRSLGRIGYVWALTGGSTEDDGAHLRVTISLETRYAQPSEGHSP